MFFLQKPSDDEIKDFIAAQSNLPFSYREVGETRNYAAPAGYPINHLRRQLGKGEKVYQKAIVALRAWGMYQTGWTELCPANAPTTEDAAVATLVKHLGFWSLNPCRVIYSFDEETEYFRQNGFGFGTLPAHSEQGEERFTIEWSKKTDAVWYELYAFARAHNPLAKIGFPFVTFLQRRFAADSYKAMVRAAAE